MKLSESPLNYIHACTCRYNTVIDVIRAPKIVLSLAGAKIVWRLRASMYRENGCGLAQFHQVSLTSCTVEDDSFIDCSYGSDNCSEV